MSSQWGHTLSLNVGLARAPKTPCIPSAIPVWGNLISSWNYSKWMFGSQVLYHGYPVNFLALFLCSHYAYAGSSDMVNMSRVSYIQAKKGPCPELSRNLRLLLQCRGRRKNWSLLDTTVDWEAVRTFVIDLYGTVYQSLISHQHFHNRPSAPPLLLVYSLIRELTISSVVMWQSGMKSYNPYFHVPHVKIGLTEWHHLSMLSLEEALLQLRFFACVLVMSH